MTDRGPNMGAPSFAPHAFRPSAAPPLSSPGLLSRLHAPYALAPQGVGAMHSAPTPAPVQQPQGPVLPFGPPPSGGTTPVSSAPVVAASATPFASPAQPAPPEVAPPFAPPLMMSAPLEQRDPANPSFGVVTPPAMLNAHAPAAADASQTPWASAARIEAQQLPSSALLTRPRDDDDDRAPLRRSAAAPSSSGSRAPIIALVVLLLVAAAALVVIVVRHKSTSNDPISIAFAGATDSPEPTASVTAAPTASATVKPKVWAKPKVDDDPYDQAERELKSQKAKPVTTATPNRTPPF